MTHTSGLEGVICLDRLGNVKPWRLSVQGVSGRKLPTAFTSQQMSGRWWPSLDLRPSLGHLASQLARSPARSPGQLPDLVPDPGWTPAPAPDLAPDPAPDPGWTPAPAPDLAPDPAPDPGQPQNLGLAPKSEAGGQILRREARS